MIILGGVLVFFSVPLAFILGFVIISLLDYFKG